MKNIRDTRNDGIDALRALLIISVIIYHYFVYWAPPFTPQNLYHFDNIYPMYLGIGRFGVNAFFEISGLVIAMTLQNSTGAADFLYRRFSRLFPAFFICALVTFISLRLWKEEGYVPSFFDYFASLTLHPEKLGARPIDGSYWSLSVEIHFYLWVAIFFALMREKFWIGITILGICAIIQSITGIEFSNYYLIGTYVSFFMLGMSFFYFTAGNNPLAATILLIVSLTLYALRHSDYSIDGNFSDFSNLYLIVVSGLIFASSRYRISNSRLLGPLPYLGRLSYTLYLLHQEIGVMLIGKLKKILGIPDLAAVAISLLTCIALSAIIFHFIEGPTQAYLRKLRSQRRKTVLASP